jgi:hypothetical protein
MTKDDDFETGLVSAGVGREDTSTTAPPHDAVAVQWLRENSENAWRKIRETYERELRRRLKPFLAQRNVFPSDAVDDIVQNVYLRLLRDDRKAIRQWLANPSVPFGAYLWHIAKNVARDEEKALRSRGTRSIDEDNRSVDCEDGEKDDGGGAEAWFEKGRGAAFVAAERADRADIDGTALTFGGELIEREVMSRHGSVLASCDWIPLEGRARRAFFAALNGAAYLLAAWDHAAVYAWFGGREVVIIGKNGQRIGSFAISNASLRAARAAMKIRRMNDADRRAAAGRRDRTAQVAIAA